MSGVTTWLGLAIDTVGAIGSVAGKLETAPTTNLGDWTVCTSSQECANECCSGTYSSGVLKCTPLDGGYRPDICVGAPSTYLSASLGDWTQCSNSFECSNGCCSGQYSSGVLKCTPLDGGYRSDICVGVAPTVRYLRGVESLDTTEIATLN